MWIKLGGLTYEIYLLHAMTGSLAYRIAGSEIDNVYLFIIYVIVVTSISFVFKACCQKLHCKITSNRIWKCSNNNV